MGAREDGVGRTNDGEHNAGRWFSVAMSAAIAIVFGVWLVALLADVEIGRITRDPTEVLDGEFWTGALSNLGILGWVTGAAIAIFTSLTTPGREPHNRLLLVSGLFAAVLALDDVFRFHEDIAPDILGLPDRFVAPIYLLVAMGIVWRFRHTLPTTYWMPGATAAVMFGLSVAADVLLDHVYFAEDAPKFVGIVAAAVYLVTLSYDVQRERWSENAIRQPQQSQPSRPTPPR